MTAAPPFNLRRRLTLLVALALFPALGLTVWSGIRERQQDARRIEAETVRIARLSAVTHRQVIDGTRHMLATLALVPEIRTHDPVGSTALLTALHQRFPAYTLLLAAGADGWTFADSVGGKRINVQDRVYFKGAVAKHGFAVGSYTIGRISRRPTLHCATVLEDGSDRLTGVVIAGLDLSWLGQVAETASLPPGSVLTVLDRDMVILARTLQPEAWIGTTAPQPMLGPLRSSPEGTFRAIGPDSIERIYGFTPLDTPDGEVVGTVVVGMPVTVAFAAADRTLLISLLLVGATGVLALGVGRLLARRLIEQPMRGLCAATARIAEGDFSATMPSGSGSGEFAALSGSISAMAQALARREQEQLTAASDLQQAHQRLGAIIASAPMAILILDPEGRLVDGWNPAAQRLYGWSREELLGRVPPLVAPAEAERWAELIQGAAQSGMEMEHLRRAGGAVRVAVYAAALSDATGQAAGCLAMIADVSENRRLQDQLNQTQKLELVGRLAGGIAHDFNNLLAVITGYGDLLARRLPEGGPQREQAEQIVRASERAAELTGRLLALSRRQTGKRTVVDVSDRVTDMTKLLARAVGEHVDVRLFLASEPCLVLADPVQLDQVVMNLVINARDALPVGGTVSLGTAFAGDQVLLTVSDTGIGMEPEVVAHLFEPFFTTKEPGRGTGLGLATVKAIVDGAGGTIHIDSRPGQGTTVHITLPRVTQSMVATTNTARQRPLPVSALVVDDEPGVLALMAATLSEAGITVTTASGGLAALAQVEHNGGPAQVVVTDLMMPGMGGTELARELRRRYPGLPVLFVSGYADERTVQEVLAFGGAAAFLAKPFTAEALVAAIRGLDT